MSSNEPAASAVAGPATAEGSTAEGSTAEGTAAEGTIAGGGAGADQHRRVPPASGCSGSDSVLGVIHPRPMWTPWRWPTLERSLVVAALGGLFGDVDGFAETFAAEAVRPSRRARQEIMLTWQGQWVRSSWTVLLAGRNIRHVGVRIDDNRTTAPAGEYRRELAAVVAPLRELADRSGARLYFGGVDVTPASLDDVVGLMV